MITVVEVNDKLDAMERLTVMHAALWRTYAEMRTTINIDEYDIKGIKDTAKGISDLIDALKDDLTEVFFPKTEGM